MQVGDFVHYIPASSFGMPENGRIKRMMLDNNQAYVVYNCAGEWWRYDDYTAALTGLDNLHPGWVDKDGNPIDTPDDSKTEEVS